MLPQDHPIHVAVCASKKFRKFHCIGSFETCSKVFIQPDNTSVPNYTFTLVGKDQKKEAGKVTIIPSRHNTREPSHADYYLAYPVAGPVISPKVTASFAQNAEQYTISPSFQDYMEADCEIDFCVAIDFTSSNGAWGRELAAPPSDRQIVCKLH